MKTGRREKSISPKLTAKAASPRQRIPTDSGNNLSRVFPRFRSNFPLSLGIQINESVVPQMEFRNRLKEMNGDSENNRPWSARPIPVKPVSMNIPSPIRPQTSRHGPRLNTRTTVMNSRINVIPKAPYYPSQKPTIETPEDKQNAVLLGKEVTKVNFSGMEGLSFAFLESIGKICPKLEDLDIGHSQKLTDKVLEAILDNCANIKSLKIDNCPLLTASGVGNVICICKHLECLSISGNGKIFTGDISDALLTAIAAKGWQWKSLDFSHCKELTDDMVISMVRRVNTPLPAVWRPSFADLTTLSIDEASLHLFDAPPADKPALARSFGIENLNLSGTNISDKGLVPLLSKCLRLRRFGLSFCGNPGLTSRSMFVLSRFAPGLLRLRCSGCPQIQSTGLASVAQLCRQLRVFKVGGCGVSDEILRRLSACCPLLQIVDVSSPEVSPEAILNLVKSCQRIKVLHCSRLDEDISMMIKEIMPDMKLSFPKTELHNPEQGMGLPGFRMLPPAKRFHQMSLKMYGQHSTKKGKGKKGGGKKGGKGKKKK
eukprot:TRINITY_DN1595_c0_g2_i1.p1 TRINITY_DN1595_c0_g2~~TRINITY_DN1595_c0_g2_i1.p1  ORF type:complete len:543 (-),score=110.44 TRINITY_DN1595_c0_g2_i1:116-1744(-)